MLTEKEAFKILDEIQFSETGIINRPDLKKKASENLKQLFREITPEDFLKKFLLFSEKDFHLNIIKIGLFQFFEEFFKFIEGRALDYGRQIGCRYGEGFKIERPVGIEDLMKTK